MRSSIPHIAVAHAAEPDTTKHLSSPSPSPCPSCRVLPPSAPPGPSLPPGRGERGRALSTSRSQDPSRSPRPPNLKILIAPSGFKEAIGPEDVATAIETGIRRIVVEETATIHKLPLHDGGEGFCKAVIAARGGELRTLSVTGPVGVPVESYYGVTGDSNEIAVLDMAAAAGLRLVPHSHRDPTKTTTFGVGQLIKAALDEGCNRIVIGCGDSGTSDGGAGMLQALGARLLDQNGHPVPAHEGGAALLALASIAIDTIHPRLRPQHEHSVTIEAVCNTDNILCGEGGVARVYGPQKGATPDQVATLSTALDRLASAIRAILKQDISSAPGSGASGGLGAGLLLLGAQLRPRSQAVNEYFHIDRVLSQPWDFVFTAEGSLDRQSAKGKMTVEIARRAHETGAQVIVLAGTIGDGADTLYEDGVEAFASILNEPLSLHEAIARTDNLLKDAAERTMRMIQIGMACRQREESAPTSAANTGAAQTIQKMVRRVPTA